MKCSVAPASTNTALALERSTTTIVISSSGWPRTWTPRSCSGTSAPWYRAPGLFLVDPRLAGQTEHPFAQDVAHDVRRAALDGVGLHAEEGLHRAAQVEGVAGGL